MEFAKYYNATNMLNNLIEKGELSSYTKDYCKGLFICSDTHDFWVSRILEGLNSEYDEDKNCWLIERNKIDKYDFCEFLKEKIKDDSSIKNRSDRDYFIDECFETDKILETVILMDDDKGVENWDILECSSYDECIETIDGGYGIVEL